MRWGGPDEVTLKPTEPPAPRTSPENDAPPDDGSRGTRESETRSSWRSRRRGKEAGQSSARPKAGPTPAPAADDADRPSADRENDAPRDVPADAATPAPATPAPTTEPRDRPTAPDGADESPATARRDLAAGPVDRSTSEAPADRPASGSPADRPASGSPADRPASGSPAGRPASGSPAGGAASGATADRRAPEPPPASGPGDRPRPAPAPSRGSLWRGRSGSKAPGRPDPSRSRPVGPPTAPPDASNRESAPVMSPRTPPWRTPGLAPSADDAPSTPREQDTVPSGRAVTPAAAAAAAPAPARPTPREPDTVRTTTPAAPETTKAETESSRRGSEGGTGDGGTEVVDRVDDAPASAPSRREPTADDQDGGTEVIDRVDAPSSPGSSSGSSSRGSGRGAAVLGAAAAGVGAVAGALTGRYRRRDTERGAAGQAGPPPSDAPTVTTATPRTDDTPVEGRTPEASATAAAPATERPKGQAPATDRPATDRPATDRPATDRATGSAAAADRPKGQAPATDRPKGQAPSTDRPATDPPSSDRPGAGTATAGAAAAGAAAATAAAASAGTTDTRTGKPADEPVEKPTDKPTDKPADTPAGTSTGTPAGPDAAGSTATISEAPTTPSRPAVGKADLAAPAPAESASERTEITPSERTDVMSPVEEPRPATEPRPGLARDRRRRRRVLFAFLLAALVLAAFLGLVALITDHGAGGTPPQAEAADPALTVPADTAAPPAPPPVPQLPRGGTTFFPQHRVVAYYGTAGTDALGILGEGAPAEAASRLEAAAAPFASPGRTVLPAMELIVSIANSTPGPDGTYHSDIDEAEARQYLDAARARQQVMIIDIQPGRADFMTAVRPWENLLREPDVSLALDPEWRMPPGQVPGKTIGTVSADEVNQVSSWLANIVATNNLPQKLFVLHQFTPNMISNPERLQTPPQLAVVQHIDGFGAPANKIGKYQELQRPQQLHLGFKLFIDEDTPTLTPEQTLGLPPAPDLVTYQ